MESLIDNVNISLSESTNEKIIKIIGVGGGGGSAVNKMYEDGKISGVTYLLCNTDKQALDNRSVPNKLVLRNDDNNMQGLGAGGSPEKGRRAAEASADEIRRILQSDNTKMVFITAGMGGGTGTGASPVIARVCKELGILTIAIVTIPFMFEGRPRVLQALKGLEELRKNIDAVLIVNNEQIHKVFPNLEVQKAFNEADNILMNAARGICDIIEYHGYMNIDFADVNAVLKNGGIAIINTGFAKGEDRIKIALDRAINSPLLNNNNVEMAERVIIAIYPPKNGSIYTKELEYLTDFGSKLQTKYELKFGIYQDVHLADDEIGVTLLASGFDINDNIKRMRNVLSPNDDKGADPIGDRERAKQDEKDDILIATYFGESAIRTKIEPLILSISELDDDDFIDQLERIPAYKRDSKLVNNLRKQRESGFIRNPQDIRNPVFRGEETAIMQEPEKNIIEQENVLTESNDNDDDTFTIEFNN